MAKDKGLKGGMFAGASGAGAVARVAKAGKAAAVGAPRGTRAPSPFPVTTFRLEERHLIALKEEALRRAGVKKADASAVLRDVLDGWLASRKAKG
jgi:hypothetical protein